MMCNNGWCTSGQKWTTTRMKTFIRLNSKGNEIIIWCLSNIWSCLLLNNHHCCMCCCCWCPLHHICVSWINNHDVHQGPKVVSSDKYIHSSLGVMREKVRNLLLNMYSIFKKIVVTISQNVSWAAIRSLLYEHRSKWIPKSSMIWPH
jgi:hypothetical protein